MQQMKVIFNTKNLGFPGTTVELSIDANTGQRNKIKLSNCLLHLQFVNFQGTNNNTIIHLPVFIPNVDRLAGLDFLSVVVTWTFFHRYTQSILILVESIWTCTSINRHKVNAAALALRGERKTGTLAALQLIGVVLRCRAVLCILLCGDQFEGNVL